MKSALLSSFVTLAQFSTSTSVRDEYGATAGIPRSLQNILDNTHNSPAYTYPTDLTRGIIPKPIHSHNDYWRDVPFFSALSNGCISVEADVWLYNSTLYVGHDILSLTPARTFDALYIQPILSVLNRQNPVGQVVPDNTKYGVFDTSGDTSLYLFVDVKTDGPSTWPAVVKALDPLREKGYLTTFNNTVAAGPVTVIGTGNTPLDQIQGVQPRDYFFDANLALLSSSQSDLTSDVAPIASAQFSKYIGAIDGTDLSSAQLTTLRNQLAVAKSRGIGGRYWDTPAWPISTRDSVWRTLVDEGVALLNADDLPAAAGYTGSAPW